jgi:vancomycin resistance protein YoaR
MKNPFGPEPDSLSAYVNLQKRMLQHVQATKVNDQIFQVVQQSFEEALRLENIVLSLPERKRMLSQILRAVLEDMLKKLDRR